MATEKYEIIMLILIHLSLVMSQNKDCYNAYECVGTEWILSGNNYIRGFGYKSISGKTTSIHGEDHVHCNAAFACEQISFIIGDTIFCFGTHSCANIFGSSYIHGHTVVSCLGVNACQNSNIISDGTVYCKGDQSCSYSNITAETVEAYGSYSLYASNIKAQNIYFRGYQSGYGSHVTSKPNDICTIYCYATGCQMTVNDKCIVILNNNNTAITIPPIENINEYNNNLLHFNMLTIQTNDQCNKTHTFDNYNQATSSIDINQTVCCRAGNSCYGAGSISSNSLVCSADGACRSSIIHTSHPVFCEGYQSCLQTTINEASNIYCLGAYACRTSSIINAT
eukprot:79417_1